MVKVNTVTGKYLNSLADTIERGVLFHGMRPNKEEAINDLNKFLVEYMSLAEIDLKNSINSSDNINGFRQAIDYAVKYNGELTEDFIKVIHLMLYYNNEPKTSLATAMAGEYRTRETYAFNPTMLGSEKHHFYPPEDVISELKKTLETYNTSTKKLEDIIRLKLDLIMVHPFSDYNGVVGRIIFNWCLLKEGYQPFIIHSANYKTYINMMVKLNNGDFNKDESKRTNDVIEFKEMMELYINNSK